MKTFSVCLSVALFWSAAAAPSAVEVNQWEAFKALHGKNHGPSDDPVRMKRFLQRSAEIEAHNARYEAGLESFSLKVNKYADLSKEEFESSALGYTPSNESLPVKHSLEVMPSLPDSLDYRTKGIMTPVRDQDGCGSCYAFAATGLLESYLMRLTGNYYDLSEQDILDCSFMKYLQNRANNGCGGGLPDVVFDYYNEKDIVLESSYKYVSGQTGSIYRCRSPNPVNNFIQGRLNHQHHEIQKESDLKQYLVQYGPVVIGLASDGKYKALFRDLGDGIFDVDYTRYLQPNHVVVLVGYGRENGKDYWLVKNSWGTSWAVGGYGKIIAGKNMANLMPSGVWFIE